LKKYAFLLLKTFKIIVKNFEFFLLSAHLNHLFAVAFFDKNERTSDMALAQLYVIQNKGVNKFKYVRKQSCSSGFESFDLFLDSSVVFDIGIVSDTSSSVSEEFLVNSTQ
jgi:hypothetical protein